jgi:hypothetical protein
VVFGTIWFSAVAAAALGNYPTPLVGYGGSAIVGYLFSVAMLPRPAQSAATGVMPHDKLEGRPPGPRLRIRLA